MAAAQAPSDEAAIRAARAASNQAIAAHDTVAWSSLFLPEYVLVTSTNARSIGRDSARTQNSLLFRSRPDVVFVRTPESVVVNPQWGQAAESGNWTGRWTQADGVTRVSGPYFAKWRKVNGRWMLLAEVYVQTSCAGTIYCRNQP
ncbi:MAG: nuclear transport factor 2 family protein [Gemmatimonadota bacterium]